MKFAFIKLALLAVLCGPTAGCMMGDDDGLSSDDPQGDQSSAILEAQVALATHDVERAQSIYNQAIAGTNHPEPGLLVGKALTDLLLLPGIEPATELLTTHLLSTGALDINAALYADEGYLYWLARGVPWEEGGSTYSGIRGLISARLPWPKSRLESVQAFFTGLITPLSEATDDLTRLADHMASIEDDIGRALEDPNFEVFYVPGELLHIENLDIYLGPAELHLLRALIAGARATIYFAAAYEYDFSLDTLLGSQQGQRGTPDENEGDSEGETEPDGEIDLDEDMDQDMPPGWGHLDNAVAFLDGELLRAVRKSSRLISARDALDVGLEELNLSIEVGMEQYYQTSMSWQDVNGESSTIARDLIVALRKALYAPTPIPGSSPQTRLDLSSFFEPGRVLDADTAFFKAESIAIEDASDASPEIVWELNSQAIQELFIDGIFDPPFDAEDPEIEIQALDEDVLIELVETLFAPLRKSAAAVY